MADHLGHERHTTARHLLASRRAVRPSDHDGAGDHPAHGAPLARIEHPVDQGRDQPAWQDHPRLRPGRPARPSGARGRAPQDRRGRDAGGHRRGHRRRRGRGADDLVRPARGDAERRSRRRHGDRQDRRPHGHPAQPHRPVRPGRARGPRPRPPSAFRGQARNRVPDPSTCAPSATGTWRRPPARGSSPSRRSRSQARLR